MMFLASLYERSFTLSRIWVSFCCLRHHRIPGVPQQGLRSGSVLGTLHYQSERTQLVGHLPASRAAFYGMRITIGLKASFPSPQFSTFLGPMTRSVRDIASLLDVLLDKPKLQPVTRCYVAAIVLHFHSFILFRPVILSFIGSPALQNPHVNFCFRITLIPIIPWNCEEFNNFFPFILKIHKWFSYREILSSIFCRILSRKPDLLNEINN